jgi:hypothetical protein
MRKQVVAALFLASLMIGGAANAAVTVSGEGVLGFVSEGKNAPLGGGTNYNSGFAYGPSSLFNNSVYISGDLAKDVSFYSELQLGLTGNTVGFNEFNVTVSGLKMGRFTAPFGYYIPSSAYSAWNKLQRQDQLGAAIVSGGVLPGFETGVMYSGKGGPVAYNVYAVQGNGSNVVSATSATVKDNLSFGGQAIFGINKDNEIGLAVYSNSDDAVNGKSSTAYDVFGKSVFGAVTLWAEYIATSLPTGYLASVADVSTSTLIAEVDFALNKQVTLAARYTTTDPNTSVADNGKSAVQVGAEFAANDVVTYGAEYTVRNNEGTSVDDDSSFTLTSQFKF